jgi:prevent-host-death family protein
MPSPKRVPKAEARKRFAEIVTDAGRGGERIKITHYGKTLAVLIPKADLERLQHCEESKAGATKARKRSVG